MMPKLRYRHARACSPNLPQHLHRIRVSVSIFFSMATYSNYFPCLNFKTCGQKTGSGTGVCEVCRTVPCRICRGPVVRRTLGSQQDAHSDCDRARNRRNPRVDSLNPYG